MGERASRRRRGHRVQPACGHGRGGGRQRGGGPAGWGPGGGGIRAGAGCGMGSGGLGGGGGEEDDAVPGMGPIRGTPPLLTGLRGCELRSSFSKRSHMRLLLYTSVAALSYVGFLAPAEENPIVPEGAKLEKLWSEGEFTE